ncbi:hypothetical protein ABMA28_016927 [Loxostege sticticalis]|uniref:MYND-type domain-containing protein n=1 Tax=Loxostege sticticalis TaxID=481309 RepID=A0ABD0T6G1_LOXSC
MIELQTNSPNPSDMADEITLNNMAACDFSAPMNVTVLFDDSDEDTKDVITLLSDQDQTKSPNEKSSLEQKTSVHAHKRKIGTKKPKKSSNESKVPENKRSRIELDDKNNNKMEIYSSGKSPKNDSNSNNTVLMPEAPTSCMSPTAETNLNNNKHTDKTLDNIDVDLMRQDFQEVRNYIQNLLKTVSEHLILIINAYQDHAKIVTENVKNRVDGHLRIHDSKTRFTRFKGHVFQLSYSAVISVILEQETNKEFLDAFLKNTEKIAHNKHQMPYTAQYIQPFFYELLNWAKQKKDFMNNYPANEILKNNESNMNNTPTLSKQLSQPPRLPPIILPQSSRNVTNEEKNKVQDSTPDQSPALPRIVGYKESSIPIFSPGPPNRSIPIFSSGPPNREVRISIQPDMLRIQNQQMAQITRTQHPPPPYPNPPTLRRQENQYHINQNNQYPNHHVVSSFFAPSNNMAVAPTATYNHQYINHAVNGPNRQNPDQVSNTNNRYQPWTNGSCTDPSQSLPSLREFRPHHSPSVCQDSRTYQQQFTSVDRNQSCCLEDRWAQNLQNISPKKVVESGRSVSTDSGFISPLQFSTGGDTSKTPSELVEQSNQFAPLITHVTSLNPNAKQIAEGSCHVCRKPTKSKCMGCYQVYYCNYQCEVLFF